VETLGGIFICIAAFSFFLLSTIYTEWKTNEEEET